MRYSLNATIPWKLSLTQSFVDREGGRREGHRKGHGEDRRPWVCVTDDGMMAMSPDLVQLPRGRRRGVPLSEGRVQSPLSRAEVGLDDLVHIWTDFGASLGSRSPSKTQYTGWTEDHRNFQPPLISAIC